MDPYYLNYSYSTQDTEDDFVLPAQSIDQDSRAPSILHVSAPEYHSTPVHPSYSLLVQGNFGPSQAPRTSGTSSARSLRPSLGGGSIRPSSLPSHPYHQARLCHIADRASAKSQGWCRPPPPQISQAPAPASDTTIPHNAVIGDHAPDHRYASSQLPLDTKRSAPTPTFGSTSHSDLVISTTDENIPSPTGNPMVPGQVFLPTYPTPPSSPDTLADQADIEFAQYRYGSKRCFYRCRFDLPGSPCNKWIVGDRTRVLRHLRNHHHLQTGPAVPAVCRWDECTHSRPMKQENLSRHVVMHLGVKWRCPHCRRLFSRDDAVHRHIERMVPGMDVTDAEVVPGLEARAITEQQARRARVG